MIVCGIDASSNKTGMAIFQDAKYIEHVLIDLHKMKDANERIPQMMLSMCDYLLKHKIDKIIMEESMMTNNIVTVKMLSNIAGAVMCYAANNNIEFQFDLPSAWRKRVGLTQGRAIKREILKAEAINAVKQEYHMDLTDDECEAILIARSGFDLPKIVLANDDLDI